MAYIVDQFNQPSVVESDPNSESNLVYMNIITESTAKRHHNLKNDLFYDEYVSPTVPLQKNENYYSHTKIKKINTVQTFNIYLIKYDNSDERTQFLKTVTVDNETSPILWYDFSNVFSLSLDFDCIVFELKRIDADYVVSTRRYPVIVYEEFSHIKKMIDSKIKAEVVLMKIRLQYIPGLINRINGEEIHI